MTNETGASNANKKSYIRDPPQMKKDLPYADWVFLVEAWQAVTEIDEEKQGLVLFLSLDGKWRSCVQSKCTMADMKSKTGVKKVLEALDSQFKKNKAKTAYEAFDHFITFRRPSDMTIDDYLIEFDQKLMKVKSNSLAIPENILGYFLLKCADLPEAKADMCRATCKDLSYSEMKDAIERVGSVSVEREPEIKKGDDVVSPQFLAANNQQHFDLSEEFNDMQFDEACAFYTNYDGEEDYNDIETDQQDAYYVKPGYYRGRGGYRPPYNSSRGGGVKTNPPDETGKPTGCSFCKSIYHYLSSCPDAPPHMTKRGRGRGRGFRGGYHNARFQGNNRGQQKMF